MFRSICLGIALLAAVPSAGAAVFVEKPRRIVSLNLCADELVLRLADRRNIASVTWLSRDPADSNVVDLAARVPVNYGLAEEVVPLNPDLIVAGIQTARTAVGLLKQAGFPVMELGVPRNLDEVRGQIRELAGAIGEPGRGERMIDDINARLAAVPVPPERRPTAIVLDPNLFTASSDSLVDRVIAAAGLVNLAPRLGVDRDGRVPLEAVLTGRPDVLILGTSPDGPPSLASQLLRHPALERLSARLAVVPSRLWACAGPSVVDAIERLSRVATDVRQAGATR